MFKLGVLLSSVVLIAGCSLIEAEKPVNYYVLDAKPVKPNGHKKQKIVAVNPIQLPDYLDQPNLVLRDSSQKLHVAFYHSWAEDFASAIRRVMISELNRNDDSIRYLQRCEECPKLTFTLNHFYPTTEGEVILAGDYVLTSEQGSNIPDAFLIEANLSADGYEHAVKQMRLALTLLAKKVIPEIGAKHQEKADANAAIGESVNSLSSQAVAAKNTITVTQDKPKLKPIRRINLKK